MTRGIECGNVVRIKATGQLGTVIGIDDHTDRFPADLQLEAALGIVKIRVDEVETFDEFMRRDHEPGYGWGV